MSVHIVLAALILSCLKMPLFDTCATNINHTINIKVSQVDKVRRIFHSPHCSDIVWAVLLLMDESRESIVILNIISEREIAAPEPWPSVVIRQQRANLCLCAAMDIL